MDRPDADETRLEIVGEDYVQDAEQVAALAAAETALVEYVPKSKAPFRLDTLVPRNMAFEVQKALNRVVNLHGNIDNYVLTHLKYPTTEQMWKGLAAEQVDSLGLYLHQFEVQQGIIIADKTGIGKGRQAAAVTRHAIVHGYIPVFVTRKDDLFSDIYRDLINIGHKDISPFMLNTGRDARIKDANGHVVFSPLTPDEQREVLSETRTIPTDSQEAIAYYKSINKPLPDPEDVPTVTFHNALETLPSGYDCIFATYSQIQSAAPFKRDWIKKLVKAGVEGSKKHPKVIFVLDESHMAGGFDTIIGKWMRTVLPQTRCCCFLSATFAKNPEVMPFYAKKTAMKETGLQDDQLVGAMKSGGLALQEIVASSLTESGQLIRRERSNKGIRIEYETISEEPHRTLNRQRVNRVVGFMNDIVRFEQEYIRPVLDRRHSKAKSEGEHLDARPKSLGVKHSPYFSRVFNVIDQMIFALKVERVAERAISLLLENKKVVIAFKSTMGAFLKDMALATGDVVGQDQVDFMLTLKKGLDGVFNYSYTDIEGNKSRKSIALDSLPQSGIDRYHEIVQQLKDEDSGLTISPIDKLLQILQGTKKPSRLGGHDGKYLRVAEVTGRNQRLNFQEDGSATAQSFRSDTEKSFRLFNKGDFDVLLINQSGSTGSSAHASEDFEDQRVRAMIIHQFELDINIEIQKRGRTNRTGQVVLPEYWYMTTDIPAEKRLLTMLKAKLKSLDANTTGSQNTSDDTLRSPDFLNKYGDDVAWEWINNNPRLSERMGRPTYHRENLHGEKVWVRNESKKGAIRQVTGRAGLLRVEEQDKLYDELLSAYLAAVKYAKQSGTYDLETEFLQLDAEVKERYLMRAGKGGSTPFGKDTVRDFCVVNNLSRPFTKQELDKNLALVLEGRKPGEVQAAALRELEINHPIAVQAEKDEQLAYIQQIEEQMEALAVSNEGGGAEDLAKRDRELGRLADAIAAKRQEMQQAAISAEEVLKQIVKHVKFWTVNQVLKIGINGMLLNSWGVFLGVRYVGTLNPYTLANTVFSFAVADQRRLIEYNLTPEQSGELSKIFTDSTDISEEDKKTVLLDWNEIVKEASLRRQERHILTENIFGAANLIGRSNKLIKYNTTDGIIKNGILMSPEFGSDGRELGAVLPISQAMSIVSGLQIDSMWSDASGRLRFKRESDSTFKIMVTKSKSFQIHTDPELRAIIDRAEGQSEDELADFVQNGGDMTASLQVSKLQLFLSRLDHFNLQFIGAARELQDWEIENEDDWKKRTEASGNFKYRLDRAFGEGSNPQQNMVTYEPPSNDYKHGVVLYERPLTDVERFNYSLIPIFSSVEVPFQAWKTFVRESNLRSELQQRIDAAADMLINEAVYDLGLFVTNNPHESGNQEFVFGDYSIEELGRAAYEDLIAEIKPIDELIEQLTIELKAA